ATGLQSLTAGTGAAAPQTFTASPDAVTDTTGTINLGTTHNFVTGEAVTYTSSGTAITGLSSGIVYYVIATDASHVQLAQAPTLANSGTAITLNSSTATGTQTLTPTLSAPITLGTVDTTNDDIAVTSTSGLRNGQALLYTTSGTAIKKLSNNTVY